MDEKSELLGNRDNPRALEECLIRILKARGYRCVVEEAVAMLTASPKDIEKAETESESKDIASGERQTLRIMSFEEPPIFDLFMARLVLTLRRGIDHLANNPWSFDEFFLQGVLVVSATWGEFTGCLILSQRHDPLFAEAIRRYGLGRHLRDDLSQDVHLTVWRHLVRFRAQTLFGYWLRPIVNHQALGYARRFHREGQFTDFDPDALEDVSDSPETMLESGENTSAVEMALGELRSYNEFAHAFFCTIAARTLSLKNWVRICQDDQEFEREFRLIIDQLFPRTTFRAAAIEAENQLRRLYNAIRDCLRERAVDQTPRKSLHRRPRGAIDRLHQRLDEANHE